MNKTITLFDMDGTLTESRQPFDRMLEPALSELSNISDIGIVSGSDYKYIQEQMDFVLNRSAIRYNTHILPCNGTKHYTPPENSADEFKLQYETSMSEHMGLAPFNDLMRLIIKEQDKFCSQLDALTGHYVDYRGSMINWCPIGRNANQKQREGFIQWDTTFHFREIHLLYLLSLKTIQDNKISVKLGGDTSFDIFPENWNKTYCLKHLSKYEKIFFVGDRCGTGGNDKELYDFLGPDRAFKTKGPSDTKNIINSVLIPKIKEIGA